VALVFGVLTFGLVPILTSLIGTSERWHARNLEHCETRERLANQHAAALQQTEMQLTLATLGCELRREIIAKIGPGAIMGDLPAALRAASLAPTAVPAAVPHHRLPTRPHPFETQGPYPTGSTPPI
jgi:hypothetical protein